MRSLKYIDPKNTSKICSKCGELNKRYKHSYKCKSCGFEANSDYNGASNIANRLFSPICSEEKVTINLASNSIMSESKAKKNNVVRNIYKEEGGLNSSQH